MEANEEGKYPLASCFKLACGVIGISPRQFWGMTYPELKLILEAHMEMNMPESILAPSRDELIEMIRRFG